MHSASWDHKRSLFITFYHRVMGKPTLWITIWRAHGRGPAQGVVQADVLDGLQTSAEALSMPHLHEPAYGLDEAVLLVGRVMAQDVHVEADGLVDDALSDAAHADHDHRHAGHDPRGRAQDADRHAGTVGGGGGAPMYMPIVSPHLKH